MPLVKINLRKGRSTAEKEAIGASVQTAMVSNLGVPDADRYQLFAEYDTENFETKKSLLADINENLVIAGVVGADDAFIVITEIAPANISFGQGLAQRAD